MSSPHDSGYRGRQRVRPPRAVVRAAVRAALGDLDPGTRVLVALSGGPDSLALCSATVRVAVDGGLIVAAATVDHGLQPGSGQIAARAAEQARILGCEQPSIVAVTVAGGPGSGGPEAAARAARYGALQAHAEQVGAATVLLGHTRDDQAETVLIRLARGAGTRSLAAMAPVTGIYRRPLLHLTREVVAAAAAADAQDDPRLTPWSDPHNSDHAYLRVGVRERVMPVLRDVLGPGAIAGLARTADQARADADALDALAGDRYCELAGGAILGSQAECEPDAIRTRLIRIHLRGAGCPAEELTWDHVRAVDALLLGRAPGQRATVALPGGRVAARVPGGIQVTRRPGR